MTARVVACSTGGGGSVTAAVSAQYPFSLLSVSLSCAFSYVMTFEYFFRLRFSRKRFCVPVVSEVAFWLDAVEV